MAIFIPIRPKNLLLSGGIEMNQFKLIDGYKSSLSLRDTQRAIKFVKDTFQVELAKALNLERISAPLFVDRETGINDDLNGVERKVEFDIKETGTNAQVVQSLAKWKRMALKTYGFSHGEGLYTDMCAIRRDDDMDNVHSIYVDQWDWERVISKDERNIEFLQSIVKKIVGAFILTQEKVMAKYPSLTHKLSEDVHFVYTSELESMYPKLTPKQREYEFVKKYKTAFIMQIGGDLKSGKPHDGRAPDYDDWSLNGDLMFYDEVLQEQLELSSMGIRVDSQSLKSQLKKRGCEERLKFPYHKGIAEGTLPLTIGGGIGQSRVCMLLLEKMHIGEVQASIWPKETLDECEKAGIHLL